MTSNPPADGGSPDAQAVDVGASVIGAPCLPSEENDPSFDGFSNMEINLPGNAPSGSPVCVVDHFRGLVTCPYGQDTAGQPPAGAAPCTTLGGRPVTGAVEPQCTDRRAADTVVWSCRCANWQGKTDDGDTYCSCPSGTACTQAVSPIGGEDDFSGAYCLSPRATGDGGTTCAVWCDPTSAPCDP